MIVSVISYSLSDDPQTLPEWMDKLSEEISGAINKGSKIILYPELFLMGLSRYVESKNQQDEIKSVARIIQNQVLPTLKDKFADSGVTIVLGSGPRIQNEVIYNSAPILKNNEWIFQDKLYLTPWETDFSPGDTIRVFDVEGLKTVVMICFDSEQPDLSLKLKHEKIGLLLIPSATTNMNGSQRVNRCASARSIELGTAVFTAPLVGDSSCELVDHNEGRQGYFLPAQEAVTCPQESYSPYSTGSHQFFNYNVDIQMLKELKLESSETKPFLKKVQSEITIK